MPREGKKSSQIAVGGVFSALCLLVMFMTSVIPFSEYITPALAGVMLAVVAIENGNKIATMVYISVAFLSLFLVPSYEAKLLFICLFGYYPMIKPRLEKTKSKIIAYFLKIILFLSTVIAAYYIMINLLGLEELAGEFGGKAMLVITMIVGTACFLAYDYSLGKYILFYNYRLRPLIIRE